MSILDQAGTSAPLVVEKIYDASPDEVWSALTDLEKMKKWYFRLDAFRPEVGFAFSFSGGTKEKSYIHDCVITRVVPGRTLAFTWSYRDYPGTSEVSFDLFKEGEKTKLVVTHSGLDSFTQDDPNFSKESFSKGWNYIFGTSLAKYLSE